MTATTQAEACFRTICTLDELDTLVGRALVEGEAAVCLELIAKTLAWVQAQAQEDS